MCRKIPSHPFTILLLMLTIIPVLPVQCASWTDITSRVFIGKDVNEGVLAAFGDFNADKNTGLFVISPDLKKVYVLEAEGEHRSFYRVQLLKIGQGVITSIVPADYDGDSRMDVLITCQVASETTVHIYWGVNGTSVEDIPYDILENFSDQPLVFDVNGDMLPDVLGQGGASVTEKSVWVASSNRTFTKQQFPQGKSNSTFIVPHSNAFIDLNDDLTADLLLTTTSGYEVWLSKRGKFVHNNTILLERLKYKYVGQVSFADLDQDSKPEMLLPVCEDEACTTSKVLMYINETNEWRVLIDKFKDDNNEMWGFVNPDTLDESWKNFKMPVTLRMGDYNMDGFPDMVVILKNKEGKQRAFLVDNVPCTGAECSPGQRTFSVVWSNEAQMQSLDLTVAAAFFDLFENGILDVVLVSLAKDDKYVPQMRMFQNGFDEDAVFVKVAVTSGICNAPCSKPFAYGVNAPGPVIKYHTTKYDGSLMQSCATQLSQSAHYALQMPYTVFGLGLTANFLDELNVGIPGAPGKGVRSNKWTSIIPNSQMIVIPYPHDNPSSWQKRLFVTPGRLVLLTGAALAGTCGFMAAIVGILHWRGKREDEKEKRQEAHRFHFDAM